MTPVPAFLNEMYMLYCYALGCVKCSFYKALEVQKCNEDKRMKKTGFYTIKYKFFEDMAVKEKIYDTRMIPVCTETVNMA